MLNFLIPIAQAAETTHKAAATGGISALGIDGMSLLYQIINFALLLFLLQRYAFPPIIKMLEERRTRIEESLKMAAEIEKRNDEINQKQYELLQSAQDESRRIITDAQRQSDNFLKEAENKAKHRAEQLTEDAQAAVQVEIDRLKRELKSDTAKLVAQATAQIIGQKLDPGQDEKLIATAIKTVEERKQ